MRWIKFALPNRGEWAPYMRVEGWEVMATYSRLSPYLSTEPRVSGIQRNILQAQPPEGQVLPEQSGQEQRVELSLVLLCMSWLTHPALGATTINHLVYPLYSPLALLPVRLWVTQAEWVVSGHSTPKYASLPQNMPVSHIDYFEHKQGQLKNQYKKGTLSSTFLPLNRRENSHNERGLHNTWKKRTFWSPEIGSQGQEEFVQTNIIKISPTFL